MNNNSSNQPLKIPKHVAIIMDGNRRWARERGKSALFGHKYMVENGVENIIQGAADLGIKYITLWVFSTENWNRDKKEVDGLMRLFRGLFGRQAKGLHEKGVRIETIGDMTGFDQDIQDMVAKWKEETKNNSKITAIFALNYGGKDEISRAVTKLIDDVQSGKLKIKGKLDQKEINKRLDTANFPPVELIIRPGGEKRLSGFLLWQAEYAELYFSDLKMPDFDAKQLKIAVEEFSRRKRRFGK